MDYPIPKATVTALMAYRDKRPQNPGLLFDRLAPDWGRQATLKKDGLDAVRTAAERVDVSLLQSVYTRWLAAARWAHAEPFTLQTDWRFVAGLGRKGPLEVGFSFSRYGFPILPGSSVKGVARAYALLVEGQTEDSSDFAAIFGRPPEGESEDAAQAGGAIFFDAFPVRVPKLELDVMNPHYPDYYQHKKPPTAWQSPIPVYFLTVAPGTEFAFAVGWRTELDGTGSRLLALARQWLEGGLKELGAGAKTTAGYGYFEEMMSVQQAGSARPVSSPIPTSPSPPAPPTTLIWRSGTVREYLPDKGRGRLLDSETNEELRFDRTAIEDRAWSPGKNARAKYATIETSGSRQVTRIRRS